MHQRYFIKISYKGSSFHGWQKQPNAPSVQEKIEEGISKIHGNIPISIVGCGRTDAGVHALNYFAHVDLSVLKSIPQFIYKLNKILPTDIAIDDVCPVSSTAHARFDATARTYHYRIHQKKNPFLNQTSWYYPFPLELDKMNEAAQLLLGEQDFTSFSKLHTDVKTNNCHVLEAKWQLAENNQLLFEVKANRFLRNMVRAIVGTLLEVGQGKYPPSQVSAILKMKNRNAAGVSVPAHGLSLVEINYPYI